VAVSRFWSSTNLCVEKTGAKKAARTQLLLGAAGALVLAAVAGASTAAASSSSSPSQEYIVTALNGTSPAALATMVTDTGGTVIATLPVGAMVTATLTASETQSLSAQSRIQVTPDVTVSTQGTAASSTRAPTDDFLQQTGATKLWAEGDTGSGVNVAVLDTGIDPLPDFSGRLVGGVDLTGAGNPFLDSYGHGTFVAGLIAGDGASSKGTYEGEAPSVGLVSVKVAGANGETDLATVIAGVDWTIEHAASLNIRVLNMSLGFVPFESTMLNPLDEVVQQAWDSGIVVVASAGNAGPFNGTILSPGDDPMIITVGSVDDGGQTNVANDLMSPFSSVGPTEPDGWYKPDLAAPGRSVVSLMAPGSTIATENPQAVIGTGNFVGTGTSFSAAITSGAAALLLADNPNDTPNQVKAAMLATASPGPVGSPFVDGHGVLNVASAADGSGVNLSQGFGDAYITSSAQGSMRIYPGDTLEAGDVVNMNGAHPQASLSVLGAVVTLPVSCTWNGATAGWITINVGGGPYAIAANSGRDFPTGNWESNIDSLQGSTAAPNLCSGGQMFNNSATYWAEVTSTDTTDPVQIRFHYLDTANSSWGQWSSSISTIPGSATPWGTTVSLATASAQSSWNPANWTGFIPSVNLNLVGSLIAGLTGTAWNGTAWNGTAWNGTAWNENAWNGTAWNGTAWNGTAWNGTAWNGTAWNGAAWNGTAWNSDLWG
jgi:serine protease AprX